MEFSLSLEVHVKTIKNRSDAPTPDRLHIRGYTLVTSTITENIVSSSDSYRKRNTRSRWLLFLYPFLVAISQKRRMTWVKETQMDTDP